MNRRNCSQQVLLRAVTALLLLSVHPVWADAQAEEYQIKAAFLCKFGNYVEWPSQLVSDPTRPFVIGVIASDEVVEELTSAARNQTVAGRSIAVRRLSRGESLDGLGIIFIARSHALRLAETLAAAEGRPILTVSESDPRGTVGSMVTFVVIDDKVRFDIALPPVERSNLKISARLLALARVVIGRPS